MGTGVAASADVLAGGSRASCSRRRPRGSGRRSRCASRPAASAAVLGITTLSPGTCVSHASRLCECCARAALAGAALRPQHERHGELTAGHEVRLRRLVDELVERERDEVDEHDLDDRAAAPDCAAPIAMPQIAASLIGVLRTRSAPNSSASPAVAPHGPPSATSSPSIEHARVGAHRLCERAGDRLQIRRLGHVA